MAKARAAITAFPRAVYVDPKRLAWPAKKASPPASKIHPAQSASSVEGGRARLIVIGLCGAHALVREGGRECMDRFVGANQEKGAAT